MGLKGQSNLLYGDREEWRCFYRTSGGRSTSRCSLSMTTRKASERERLGSCASAVVSLALDFTGPSVAWHSCESVEPHPEPRQDSHLTCSRYLNLTVLRPLTLTTNIARLTGTLLVTEASDIP